MAEAHNEIRHLCTDVGAPEQAAGFIKRRLTVAQAKTALAHHLRQRTRLASARLGVRQEPRDVN